MLIQSPNLALRREWARCPLISLPSGNQTACRDSLLRDRESVTPVVLTSLVINVTSPTASFSLSSSQIVLSGELTADRVIFNFPGTEGTLNIFKNDTVFKGTLLVPHRPEKFRRRMMTLEAVVPVPATLRRLAKAARRWQFKRPTRNLSYRITAC